MWISHCGAGHSWQKWRFTLFGHFKEAPVRKDSAYDAYSMPPFKTRKLLS